jgi:hypothetical protein
MDSRCKANERGNVGSCLSYQTATTCALWVSHNGLAVLTYSLHGTYLPPSYIRQQRPIPQTPTQPLLQDKLAYSRLRYFADVIFTRPGQREISRFERGVLTVMWPLATGILALALSEGIGYWLRQKGSDGFRWNGKEITMSLGNSTLIEPDGAMRHKGSSYWPTVCSGLAIQLIP